MGVYIVPMIRGLIIIYGRGENIKIFDYKIKTKIIFKNKKVNNEWQYIYLKSLIVESLLLQKINIIENIGFYFLEMLGAQSFCSHQLND